MAISVASGGILDTGGIAVGDGASRQLRKYVPSAVHMIWGGIPIHLGAATGQFISISHTVPRYKLVKGTDGEGVRVRSNDFSARVSLTIRAGSGTNDVLSFASAADDLSGLLAVPLWINDGTGSSLYTSPLAFLEAPADVSFGTEEGNVIWDFLCDVLIGHTGGSNRATDSSRSDSDAT